MDRWDKYFHDLCITASTKSTCLSRKIGALLVRDRSVISMGFNGPPRGIPHCGHDRFMCDETPIIGHIPDSKEFKEIYSQEDINTTCPRRLIGFASGEGMQYCPAQHAEENAVSNAARLGTSVLGSTLYMNSIIPCQKCFGTLINAGISEIVIEKKVVYDIHTKFLIDSSNIYIREFDLT